MPQALSLCRDCQNMVDCWRCSKLHDWIMEHIEPKVTGTWLPKQYVLPHGEHYTNYFCSVCGRKLIGTSNPSDAPYCHCGARMDAPCKDSGAYWLEVNPRTRSTMFRCSACGGIVYDMQGKKGAEKRCRYARCPHCGLPMSGTSAAPAHETPAPGERKEG